MLCVNFILYCETVILWGLMGVLVPFLNFLTGFAYFTGENTQLITTFVVHNPVTNFIQ